MTNRLYSTAKACLWLGVRTTHRHWTGVNGVASVLSVVSGKSGDVYVQLMVIFWLASVLWILSILCYCWFGNVMSIPCV